MGTHNDLTPIKSRIVGYDTKPADQFNAHPHNWRKHPQRQREAVAASLRELGWIAPVIENRQTGNLIDGHERVWQALQRGEDVPYMLVDLSPEEEALALATFDAITGMAETDAEALDRLLAEVSTGEAALMELIAETAAEAGLYEPEKGVKPERRQSPIDIIFTWGDGDNTCCLFIRCGWLFGVQSSPTVIPRLCPYANQSPRHAVQFVDNDYFNYDHRLHTEVVTHFRPKYATTRDIMTEVQCEKAGIAYYPMGQILEWADELLEHAANVIVIPKYDCIDQIPERFMLGYSVPTSHGGTPLPVDAFRGRRVHLLGGSWKAQLEYMAALGDDVVSLDNNYLANQSRFGAFVLPDGSNGQVTQTLGFDWAPRARDIALSISANAVVAAVNELYAGSAVPAE